MRLCETIVLVKYWKFGKLGRNIRIITFWKFLTQRKRTVTCLSLFPYNLYLNVIFFNFDNFSVSLWYAPCSWQSLYSTSVEKNGINNRHNRQQQYTTFWSYSFPNYNLLEYNIKLCERQTTLWIMDNSCSYTYYLFTVPLYFSIPSVYILYLCIVYA